MRKTKIVATIGPACCDEAVFRDMCLAGLNVARLNFSHGTHEEHLEKINMIKSVRKSLGLPIAIMLDTKGLNTESKHLKTDLLISSPVMFSLLQRKKLSVIMNGFPSATRV